MPTPTGIERRRLRRVMKRIPCAFEAGKLRGKGHIKNISKEGLFVRTSVLPTAGTSVRVVFHDRQGSKVEVRGTTRWTTAQLPPEEKAKPGFGLYVEPGNAEFNEFFEGILTG
ncbi:MAG: PilZ domain-containing protein [Myxococcota bacterium]